MKIGFSKGKTKEKVARKDEMSKMLQTQIKKKNDNHIPSDRPNQTAKKDPLKKTSI